MCKRYPMKYGDKGANVFEAQGYLQGLGSGIKLTGDYNVGMMSAVKKIQKDYKLPVTGVIDKKTWKLLKKENGYWAKRRRKKIAEKQSK